jgi:hypothetical protein
MVSLGLGPESLCDGSAAGDGEGAPDGTLLVEAGVDDGSDVGVEDGAEEVSRESTMVGP